MVRGIAEAGGDVAVLDIAENAPCELAQLEKSFGMVVKYYSYVNLRNESFFYQKKKKEKKKRKTDTCIRTDVSDKDKLEQTFTEVIGDFGHIDGWLVAHL